jgi:hypothetical protein
MNLAPTHLVRMVGSWPVLSQQAACTNARVASAALAERRRERDEVEDFLARHGAATVEAAGSRTRMAHSA